MDTSEKSDLFDDAVVEFKSSLTLINKKFSIIDKKVDELG
jgi:hypothetical protein